MSTGKGNIYHEHTHHCGTCRRPMTAYWIHQWIGNGFDCSCEDNGPAACEDCVRDQEAAAHRWTEAWKQEAAR